MNFRQTVKRFFEPVRENPTLWTKAIIKYFLFSIGPMISVLFLKYITQSIEKWDKILFQKLIVFFILTMTIYYIIRVIFRNRWRVTIISKWEKDIYKKYIPWFISLDNTAIEKIGTWRMISIIQQGFRTWIDLISLLFWKWIDLLLWLWLTCYVIRSTKASFLIIFVIILFIVHIIVYHINFLILENKRLINPVQNEYVRNIIRILMSKFEIMQQHKTNKEVQKLDKNRNTYYTITKKRSLYVEGNYLIPNLLVFLLYLCLFYIVGYGIFDTTYTFSDFVFFASTLSLLDWTLEVSSTAIKDFFQDYSQIEQLWETFDRIPKNLYTEGKDFTYIQWNIIVQKVNFWYEDNSVFDNFSLELKWGTKTAFVGESGWGKTTLIKLLAGYLRTDSGEIIIDGQKLSEVKLTDYYRHIGYLTQEPSVFDGTVWENLTYALDDNQEEDDQREQRIHEIIQLAKCEFIYEFEHWLQTEIGERWVRLSGWQKQRLAIAKIMLKNPNIILLDEPTSALDSFNEELVTEALHNLFKWRTVIVVAHRLQTVKNADRILYIEWGQVIEDGTHTSLIKKNGNYKKMLDLQSGF